MDSWLLSRRRRSRRVRPSLLTHPSSLPMATTVPSGFQLRSECGDSLCCWGSRAHLHHLFKSPPFTFSSWAQATCRRPERLPPCLAPPDAPNLKSVGFLGGSLHLLPTWKICLWFYWVKPHFKFLLTLSYLEWLNEVLCMEYKWSCSGGLLYSIIRWLRFRD